MEGDILDIQVRAALLRASDGRAEGHILVLREGHVIEEGTHEELLERDGEYARLARAHALEEEIEAMD